MFNKNNSTLELISDLQTMILRQNEKIDELEKNLKITNENTRRLYEDSELLYERSVGAVEGLMITEERLVTLEDDLKDRLRDSGLVEMSISDLKGN